MSKKWRGVRGCAAVLGAWGEDVENGVIECDGSEDVEGGVMEVGVWRGVKQWAVVNEGVAGVRRQKVGGGGE